MLYTRKFEATDPKEALHYFYFLRSVAGLHLGRFVSSDHRETYTKVLVPGNVGPFDA